jgi:chromosome segregation ATPase
MSIEFMMYFALGALASALIMLMIMPAVWRRAVRLTKKRIEAATPITMAEFRADKDQLRAEFALSTRRLEMNVEQLRKRLSEQVNDFSRKKHDFAQLKGERDEHLTIVRELEEREAELRARLLDLEKEGTDLAQRLRMRDRELAQKSSELQNVRDAIKSKLPSSIRPDGKALTGDYDGDVDELLTALAVERKRAGFLEEQAQSLLTHMEKLDRKSVDTNAAIAELRRSLARKDDDETSSNHQLAEAEVRIANAESQLNALLAETSQMVSGAEQKHEHLLAEKLSLEAQLEQLHEKISGVEAGVMADWDTERLEQSHLRERLNDIASEVSRLVYAVDNNAATDPEESLFDRVQRFADDGKKIENFPVRNGAINRAPANGNGSGSSSVSDRMAALRELQGGN